MKRILFSLFFLAACIQKPVPVANETASLDPSLRPAIEVRYVAVPTMIVYARPDAGAPQIGSYGLTEAISILDRIGVWTLFRTFTGDGWVKSADLMTGAEIEKIATDATPRFYIAPAAVPFGGRGEIILQAKVNTDGSVIEVTPVKNTTGSQPLAGLNASALKEARFYPLVDKGTRKTFVYEHHIYY